MEWILTVNDLLQSSANRIGGVDVRRFRAAAQHAQPGSFPTDRTVDHKLAPNPYDSLYGARWREEIAKTAALSHFCVFTDRVKHMAVETSAMFAGTAHANDCMFYHDALSLLTAQDTVAWMKENRHTDGRTYYEMWIIPVQGLKSGTVYANRLPGNSPELMPLDSSLNQDIHNAVNQHVIWTHHLNPGDPGFETKFSHATPKQQTSAFLRLLEPGHGPEAGTPLFSRICQDIGKFIPALEDWKRSVTHVA